VKRTVASLPIAAELVLRADSRSSAAGVSMGHLHSRSDAGGAQELWGGHAGGVPSKLGGMRWRVPRGHRRLGEGRAGRGTDGSTVGHVASGCATFRSVLAKARPTESRSRTGPGRF